MKFYNSTIKEVSLFNNAKRTKKGTKTYRTRPTRHLKNETTQNKVGQITSASCQRTSPKLFRTNIIKKPKHQTQNLPLKNQHIHISPSGLALCISPDTNGEKGGEIYPNYKASINGKSRHPKD